jgi:cation diffusion facilitator family transporter
LASFLLSLFAIWLSQRKPTKKMSFGYHRAEVLGAVASIFMIWVLTGVLVYLAIERFINPDYEINTNVMMIVSGSGVAINILMGITLSDSICGKKGNDSSESGHHGHGHSHGGQRHGHSHASHGHSHANMNVRAALIHVLGDLVQSIGVLIAAIIIHYKPQWKFVDPICTILFSILVMFTTFRIMKDAVYVLMEGFPLHLDYASIKEALQRLEGVKAAHSLHIWSLTLNRSALSVHLAIDSGSDPERILKLAESFIRKEYDIQQTTIQVERYDERAMNNCDSCKGPQK